MAVRQKTISEMAIGEEGFCSLKALYGGPVRPVWGKGAKNSGKPLTTRTFLLDSPIIPARSAECTLHVRREMMGFSVRFPEAHQQSNFASIIRQSRCRLSVSIQTSQDNSNRLR